MLVPPASDAIRMLRLTELLAPDRLVEGFAVNDAHAPPSKLIQNWLPMLGTVERYQFGAPNLVWLPMIDPSELNHTVAVEVPLPAASLDAPQLMGVTMPPPPPSQTASCGYQTSRNSGARGHARAARGPPEGRGAARRDSAVAQNGCLSQAKRQTFPLNNCDR